MDELIECRECTSTHCRGCNIYILSCALRDGKFDSLMNANHCVSIPDKVTVTTQGRWEYDVLEGTPGYRPICLVCSKCHRTSYFSTLFCPNCGAQMYKED